MNNDFTKSIVQLARSSPNSWNEFLAAYRAYSLEVLKQVLSSPTEALQVAQGRAKQAEELLRIFENAPRIAEQIEKRNT